MEIMPPLVLHVQRLAPGFYRWVLGAGNEALDMDDDCSSIAECLNAGAGAVPHETNLLEVRYRSISVGTFKVRDLEQASEQVADIVMERFSAVMDEMA